MWGQKGCVGSISFWMLKMGAFEEGDFLWVEVGEVAVAVGRPKQAAALWLGRSP